MGIHYPLDRRTFLVAGGLSFFGRNFAHGAGYATRQAAPGERKVAQSAIMIWLSGGASHIDTWDMKPDAPAEYRGLFNPVVTSAPGIRLCEHLPHLAKQAHHLAIVRSLGDHGRGTGFKTDSVALHGAGRLEHSPPCGPFGTISDPLLLSVPDPFSGSELLVPPTR